MTNIMNHIDLVDVTPPTLKQRVLEDAEAKRRQYTAVQIAKLHALVIGAGIVAGPHDGETRVGKQGDVRFDVDGIAFKLTQITDYDPETGSYKNARDGIEASKICVADGCLDTIYHGHCSDVQRLGDLAPLFKEDGLERCNRDHSRPRPEVSDEDLDLGTLPF